MARSWFGWFTGKRDGLDRRAELPPPALSVTPRDIDPLTGALSWDRFLALFDAEQAQAPGVLLIVDLGARSDSIEGAAAGRQGEILPWLAQAIRQAIRADDLLAHVNGYRFAVLLRGARHEVGAAISRRILQSVDNTIFMTGEGVARLDIAIGGAAFARAPVDDPYAAALDNLGRARSLGSPVILQ